MKLSILTTITNPKKRQDKFKEAFECYKDLADEVIIVDGGNEVSWNNRIDDLGKMKVVYLSWPEEWNWIELPRHLNKGREACTGDFIIKLDIDQLFHEKDFEAVRSQLEKCPKDIKVATFQKMSMVYGGKYYQKGGQPIAFRNEPKIVIGKNLDKQTDLCYAIEQTGTEDVRYKNGEGKEKIYKLPIGKDLITYKTGVQFWNYDYFFKDKRFTKREFWRFSRAYHSYFKTWNFGNTPEKSFETFLNMMKGRFDKAPYVYKLSDHPKYIRQAVEKLKPEQFGCNAWKEI